MESEEQFSSQFLSQSDDTLNASNSSDPSNDTNNIHNYGVQSTESQSNMASDDKIGSFNEDSSTSTEIVKDRNEVHQKSHPDELMNVGESAQNTLQSESLLYLQNKLYHLVDQYINLQTTLNHHLMTQAHQTPLETQFHVYDNLNNQIQALLEINEKKANLLCYARDQLFSEIWMLKNKAKGLRQIIDTIGNWIEKGETIDVEMLEEMIDQKVPLANI